MFYSLSINLCLLEMRLQTQPLGGRLVRKRTEINTLIGKLIIVFCEAEQRFLLLFLEKEEILLQE
jgi:hypothetical protein